MTPCQCPFLGRISDQIDPGLALNQIIYLNLILKLCFILQFCLAMGDLVITFKMNNGK